MKLTRSYLRSIRRLMMVEGFDGLTKRPDGSDISAAYIVVLAEKAVPYGEDGFIAVKHYTPGAAIPHEVGALEAFRFIVDESAATPAFLRSTDEYNLYPATRTNHK